MTLNDKDKEQQRRVGLLKEQETFGHLRVVELEQLRSYVAIYWAMGVER